jgi:hypothetical protein
MKRCPLLLLLAAACASTPPPRPPPEPVREAAPPPPSRPVDPNAPQPMPVEDFRRLIHTIDLSPTGDQGKIAIIKAAAAENWFIVGEVAMLIDHVTHRQSKLDLIPILNPRITDRSEAYRLIDKFTYREDKAIVARQLAAP